MKVIDLTHTISEDMPVYPGTEPPKLQQANTYEVDGFKETLMSMYSHTGTHMDPPNHLFADRTTLDAFPAEQFVGKALVIDCRDLGEGDTITIDRIKKYGKKAEDADFLLFNLDRLRRQAGLVKFLSIFKQCGVSFLSDILYNFIDSRLISAILVRAALQQILQYILLCLFCQFHNPHFVPHSFIYRHFPQYWKFSVLDFESAW